MSEITAKMSFIFYIFFFFFLSKASKKKNEKAHGNPSQIGGYFSSSTALICFSTLPVPFFLYEKGISVKP